MFDSDIIIDYDINAYCIDDGRSSPVVYIQNRNRPYYPGELKSMILHIVKDYNKVVSVNVKKPDITH